MPAFDRADQLLDAAVVAIGRHGLSRFTVDDVGRVAGVTRQTVYRYFPSRRDLVDAVAHRQERRLLEGLEAEFEAADTLAEAIRSAAALTIGMLRASTVIISLLEREPAEALPFFTTDATTRFARAARAVRRLLAGRVGQGIPPHTIESAGDGFVRLIVSYLLTPSDLSDRQIADRVTALLLPALVQ